jgi:MFS family permease
MADDDEGAPAKPASRRRVRLGEMWRLVKAAPDFRNYSIAAFFFRISQHMPTALYAIYRVRTLGASDAWIGVLLTVERVVSIGAYFTLSRLLSRKRFRRGLWLSCVGAALYPLTMAMAQTPEMLLIPSVFGGVFGAGISVYLSDTLFRVAPEEQRPMFLATNTFLMQLTAFLGPILGTTLADLTSLPAALIVAGGLRVLMGLGFRLLGVGGDRRDTRAPAS